MPTEPTTSLFRRRRLWLGGVVAMVLLPKCLACVSGYVVLAMGLAATVPEICGTVAPAGDEQTISTLVIAGVVGAVLAVFAARYFLQPSNKPALSRPSIPTH